MNQHSNPWSEERTARFKALYADGLSHSLIGEQLGVTRNACIGKAKRLGLPQRTVITARPRPYEQELRVISLERKPKAPKPEPIAEPEIAAPIPKMLPLLDLTNHTCRWPYGDKDFRFCGHEPRTKSPYCEYHTRQAGWVGDPANLDKFMFRMRGPAGFSKSLVTGMW